MATNLSEALPIVERDSTRNGRNLARPAGLLVIKTNEGQTKEQDDKIRSFFKDVGNQNKVNLEEFKGVVNKAADEFKTDSDGLAQKLTTTAPKLLRDAVDGATSTLTSVVKELMPKK